ncbi:hypothetical protein [Nitrosomonas communis]|uniref:hypothetical protein n=1 Tax=Nitrosomonas communis TaxID=44574 RepID=UPI003D2C486F
MALSSGNAVSEDAVIHGHQCAGRMMEAMRRGKGACRPAPPVGIPGRVGRKLAPRARIVGRCGAVAGRRWGWSSRALRLPLDRR